MKHSFHLKTALIFIFAVLFCTAARAQFLDQIGLTTLRTVTTNLDGAGVRVAQPEAVAPVFEINPAMVNQPASLFTYISAAGTASSFPNSVGNESGHADAVGGYFYGLSSGLATNVAHVDNYDAGYFYNNIIATPIPPNINDHVVNQSFIFTGVTIAQQQAIDTNYDDYAAQYDTLFVSGVGNGGAATNPPATCYNGIGVGAYGGGSSVGPTLDNGRAKPDIIAPAEETSYSTPQVAGAAAVLFQAGLRGDGGASTNAATDIRTLKALLLNGAVKPADWTNNSPSPLDTRYGAGVLNVFNSYEQLAGGKHGYIASTSVVTNSPHPPTGDGGTVSAFSGWDFNTNSSSASNDAIKHYYFNATNNLSVAPFTATATLVWNRHQNKTNINNLDLFLYDAISSNLVACSTSLVDNVEHIFVPQLPPGRYDLQVLKKGGTTVTTNETYALAWEFFSMPLNIAAAGTNAVLAWPVYPTGFVLESTTNLAPPSVWSTNDLPPPSLTNNQNYLLLNATNANQFFRLCRPNF
jgi:hypothetical protein